MHRSGASSSPLPWPPPDSSVQLEEGSKVKVFLRPAAADEVDGRRSVCLLQIPDSFRVTPASLPHLAGSSGGCEGKQRLLINMSFLNIS